MPVGRFFPLLITTIHPTVAVTRHRFIRFGDEQATVLGQRITGGAPENITAGTDGACIQMGSVVIEAGAPIALDGTGIQWVMTDANGRAITYVAGNAVAGFIKIAASAATHEIEVFLLPLGAGIAP